MPILQENIDPTEELDLATVKKRAVKGVLALTGRTFFLQIATIVAQGFLWAFLTPEQFGVFWVVSAIVNFLVYFSDIGLAAALIQKKSEPTDEDLKTTFTVQQALVVILLLIIFVLGSVLGDRGVLSHEGKVLLYALGVSFFLSSLKSIPSVLLERRLEFGKFIVPQVLENLVYNVAVVYFAWRGFGITSFSYAVIARGLVGLFSMYLVRPWMPGFRFSKQSLKELFKFGVPYQANTLLAVVKDSGVTIFLGGVLGAGGVGILGTAQRLSQFPLVFMSTISQVSFPAFSRMQDDRKELSNFVNRSIFFISFMAYPAMVGLLVMAPVVMQAIPRYQKWSDAIIPLYFISINTFFAVVSTQLTNLFNAVGKIRLTFYFMIMWTGLTVVLVPVLSLPFGVVGAAIGYGIVGLSSIVVIIVSRKYVDIDIRGTVIKPFAASVVMGAVLYALAKLVPSTILYVVVLAITGVAVYLVLLYLLVGSKLIADVKRGLATIFRRSLE